MHWTRDRHPLSCMLSRYQLQTYDDNSPKRDPQSVDPLLLLLLPFDAAVTEPKSVSQSAELLAAVGAEGVGAGVASLPNSESQSTDAAVREPESEPNSVVQSSDPLLLSLLLLALGDVVTESNSVVQSAEPFESTADTTSLPVVAAVSEAATTVPTTEVSTVVSAVGAAVTTVTVSEAATTVPTTEVSAVVSASAAVVEPAVAAAATPLLELPVKVDTEGDADGEMVVSPVTNSVSQSTEPPVLEEPVVEPKSVLQSTDPSLVLGAAVTGSNSVLQSADPSLVADELTSAPLVASTGVVVLAMSASAAVVEEKPVVLEVTAFDASGVCVESVVVAAALPASEASRAEKSTVDGLLVTRVAVSVAVAVDVASAAVVVELPEANKVSQSTDPVVVLPAAAGVAEDEEASKSEVQSTDPS